MTSSSDHANFLAKLRLRTSVLERNISPLWDKPAPKDVNDEFSVPREEHVSMEVSSSPVTEHVEDVVAVPYSSELEQSLQDLASTTNDVSPWISQFQLS